MTPLTLSKTLALALCLPLLSAVGMAEVVTIYMESGDEKHLSIDIPREYGGKSDHYRKAYVIEYMRWWNMGLGLTPKTLPYSYDPEKYKNTTPPREIDSRVESAVHSHFLKGNILKRDALYWQVQREAKEYIDKLNYTGDQNVSERVVNKVGGIGLQPNITVPIPPRFSSRADEYAKAYALRYMEHWNSLWLEKSAAYPKLSVSRNSYDFWRYESSEPFVSGDIEKYVEKLFADQGLYAEVEKALEAHLKDQSKKK